MYKLISREIQEELNKTVLLPNLNATDNNNIIEEPTFNTSEYEDESKIFWYGDSSDGGINRRKKENDELNLKYINQTKPEVIKEEEEEKTPQIMLKTILKEFGNSIDQVIYYAIKEIKKRFNLNAIDIICLIGEVLIANTDDIITFIQCRNIVLRHFLKLSRCQIAIIAYIRNYIKEHNIYTKTSIIFQLLSDYNLISNKVIIEYYNSIANKKTESFKKVYICMKPFINSIKIK